MKVSIYLTQFSENSKKFHVDRCPSYGRSSKWSFQGRNTNRPFTAWRVDDMGLMSIGICRGPLELPKDTFWEVLQLTVFLVNREHMTCLSWAAAHLVYELGRSKLIWVVSLRIVYEYVMSKWKNFYRGGNGAHFRGFLGFGAIASRDLKIFSWDLGYPWV